MNTITRGYSDLDELLKATESWDIVDPKEVDDFINERGQWTSQPVPLSIDAAAESDLPESVSVSRDWDELKCVVVGRSDNDVIPQWYPTPDGKDQNEVEDPSATGKTKKEYNPEMFRRSQKQHDALCEIFEKEGVQVFRPPALPLDVAKADPVGLSQAWVRECFTVFGKKLVVNQPRTPHRNKDHEAMEPFFSALEQAGLCTVHRLPPCSFEKNTDWKNDPRPFLEGGDIFRFGKDVIVTMSYLASSPAGYRWLSDLLEPDGIEVWPAYLTDEWEHGDYILMPVREGLCVAYLKGFVDGLLPSPITDWDCIPLTRDEADSKFAANGIIIRENVVLLPRGCQRVARALERKGVDVIEMAFDGPCFWQGGIDCSTSELWRGDSQPALSVDAQGHKHKGKGEGGGQFISTSTVERTEEPKPTTGGKVKKAYQWLHSTGQRSFRKLPKPVKTALSVAFAGWTASQAIAERISVEKGATPEQAAKLRSILAAADMVAFKPVAVATAGLGAGIGAATWVVPPVTACYLAHSAVAHPVATYRAARSIVEGIVKSAKGDIMGGTGLSVEVKLPMPTPEPMRAAMSSEASALARVADSISAAIERLADIKSQQPIINIAPPAVNVEVKIPEQQPSNITVSMPSRKTVKETTVERDRSGDIKSMRTEETEVEDK